MAGAVLLWAGWFTMLALTRWNRFGYPPFDLGIFDQGLWLLSRGEEPFVTLRGLHLLADHASYLLWLLVPLYWVWADPRALILLSVLAPALAAWLSYRIALAEGEHPWRSVGVGMVVLLLPAMAWTPWDAFHTVVPSANPEHSEMAPPPPAYATAGRAKTRTMVRTILLIGAPPLSLPDVETPSGSMWFSFRTAELSAPCRRLREEVFLDEESHDRRYRHREQVSPRGEPGRCTSPIRS